MAKTLRPLALLLTVATVAMMAGCASIYAPSKEAMKQFQPDGEYAPVYLHLAQVMSETSMDDLRKACEKLIAEDKPRINACDHLEDYVVVRTTSIIVGGMSYGGRSHLPKGGYLVKKSLNPEPGMIMKVDQRLDYANSVLELRKPTEDCRWVGVVNPNLDTFETKAKNNLEKVTGSVLGLAIGPVAAPIGFAMQYSESKDTGGVVCEGWDYRIAYKTWLENYRDM
jgi:hypothetical protein